MVLKGSIGTFDIISIIQMVTSQQVTGVLHIQGPDKKDIFEILIENGMIVRAAPMTEAPVRYSAQRLHKAGLLGSGQFKVLMAGIKKEDINEADIPKRFSVPVSSMKRLILSITYESLHRMYALKSGTYEFEPKKIEYDPQLIEPMNTEFVLMESSRVVDEVVHSNWTYRDDVVFQKTAIDEKEQPKPVHQPPVTKTETKSETKSEEEFIIERTAAPVEVQKAAEEIPEEQNKTSEDIPQEHHKTTEDMLLELIDGKRTVGSVYFMSLLSKNEVILELGNMLKAGKIAAFHVPKAQILPRKTPFAARIISASKTVLVLVVNIVILLTILYYSKINPLNTQEKKREVRYSNLLKYIGKYQQIKLTNALEIYKLEYGSYPDSLKALVDRHIVRSKDLTFPYGSEYYYTVQDGTYILIAPKYAAK